MTQAQPLVVQTPGVTYEAADFRGIFDVLFSEGVMNVPAGQLLVTALTDGTLRVAVAAGQAVVKGDDVPATQGSYILRCTAGENVTVQAPPSTGSRLDLLVYEEIDADLVALAGRPAGARFRAIPGAAVTTGSPVLPTLPNTAIPLASFPVAAGQTSILAASITDLRTQAGKASIGFARLDVQTFTTSGTWTKPQGAAYVLPDVMSGGGGGGDGYPGALTDVWPGQGGGGGGRVQGMYAAAVLPATVPVVVGAGGTRNPINTLTVTDAGASSFGGLVVTGGKGGPGANSANRNGALPTAGGGYSPPYQGGGNALGDSRGYTGVIPPRGTDGVLAGGGGGGTVGSGGSGIWPGGVGGGSGGIAGGAAGAVNGTVGGPGGDGATTATGMGTGGGGGAGGSGATVGGKGGNGAIPGGAGGAGGCTGGSPNTPGAGGTGARGEVRVITLCL